MKEILFLLKNNDVSFFKEDFRDYIEIDGLHVFMNEDLTDYTWRGTSYKNLRTIVDDNFIPLNLSSNFIDFKNKRFSLSNNINKYSPELNKDLNRFIKILIKELKEKGFTQ